MTETTAFSNKDIQAWFQGMLVHHVPVETSGIQVGDIVNPSGRLSAQRHLSIYRQSYIARLRECMKCQFKGLAYALGNELFEAFAEEYLDSHPSHSYTLNDLGQGFPAFLQNNRPDAGSSEKEDWPDFMVALASFELQLSEVFDMEEPDQTAVVDDTEDDRLKVSASLRLFDHQHPICSYYLQFNAGASPELPLPEQEYCAVARQDYRLGLFKIASDQYYFLKCMLNGDNISIAKANLLRQWQTDPLQFDQVWPTWKQKFIQAGFFSVSMP